MTHTATHSRCTCHFCAAAGNRATRSSACRSAAVQVASTRPPGATQSGLATMANSSACPIGGAAPPAEAPCVASGVLGATVGVFPATVGVFPATVGVVRATLGVAAGFGVFVATGVVVVETSATAPPCPLSLPLPPPPCIATTTKATRMTAQMPAAASADGSGRLAAVAAV